MRTIHRGADPDLGGIGHPGSNAPGHGVPILHLVYPLAGSCVIEKPCTTGEGSEEQIVLVGSAEPAGNDGSYTVRFLELGRPRAYDGKNALTIEPKEKRVLVLPAGEFDADEKS